VNKIYVHTNAKQMVGAIVSMHSLKRNSAAPDTFNVEILNKEHFGFFKDFEGRKFLRGGKWRKWDNDDLQSFTPTRFMPPELSGYQGRAIVIDPDVFAVGDVSRLFMRDMEGAAVMAKPRPGHKDTNDYIASSVMLLDCTKLEHWRVEEQFASMFEGKLDYDDWIVLRHEPKGSVKFLEPFWNDFDHFGPQTQLLHNTKRNTQPWKTGLPIDYTNRLPVILRWMPVSGFRLRGKYKAHPDHLQEELFFSLARECVDQRKLDPSFLREEMKRNHVRHDAAQLMEKARAVDQILAEAQSRAA
jgi:hypothetical protein